jgi:hypothetical protein
METRLEVGDGLAALLVGRRQSIHDVRAGVLSARLRSSMCAQLARRREATEYAVESSFPAGPSALVVETGRCSEFAFVLRVSELASLARVAGMSAIGIEPGSWRR